MSFPLKRKDETMLMENMEPPIPANSFQTLTCVGTLGWLALVLLPPLIKGEIAYFFLSLLIPGIVIVDVWGVAPAAIQGTHDPELALKAWWVAALVPWGVLAWLVYRACRKNWPRLDETSSSGVATRR